MRRSAPSRVVGPTWRIWRGGWCPSSPVRRPGNAPGPICRAGSARRSDRTAGQWRKCAARRPRMASNMCSVALTGTPPPSAMSCAPPSSNIWGTPTACWSWMRLGFSKKAGTRPGWRASRRAPSARGRTATWACFWAPPVGGATPWWTGNCMCPRRGRITVSVAGRSGSRRTGPLPPSRSGPARGSPPRDGGHGRQHVRR